MTPTKILTASATIAALALVTYPVVYVLVSGLVVGVGR